MSLCRHYSQTVMSLKLHQRPQTHNAAWEGPIPYAETPKRCFYHSLMRVPASINMHLTKWGVQRLLRISLFKAGLP